MPHVIIDPESRSLATHCALVRVARRSRARFPEGCVTLVADAEEARNRATAASGVRPAEVYGPSSSSEGQRIYYLVRWL